MSNRQVKAVVLYSRKQTSPDWLVRNDRLYDRDAGLEKSMAAAERQREAWQDCEPFTQFKIEIEFH